MSKSKKGSGSIPGATPTSNKLGVNGVDSQKVPRSGPKGKWIGDSSGNNKLGVNGV